VSKVKRAMLIREVAALLGVSTDTGFITSAKDLLDAAPRHPHPERLPHHGTPPSNAFGLLLQSRAIRHDDRRSPDSGRRLRRHGTLTADRQLEFLSGQAGARPSITPSGRKLNATRKALQRRAHS